jgi:hypothetical protein
MSDTPRTDAAIKASKGQWGYLLRDLAQEMERELAAERALSSEMAAQLEHASFAYDPGGCQKMFEAWKDAREP